MRERNEIEEEVKEEGKERWRGGREGKGREATIMEEGEKEM